MKTNWRDVFIFPLLGIIAALSFFIVKAAAGLLSERLGDYHFVAEICLLLFCFGLLSALFLQVLVKLWPLRPGKYLINQAYASYWKLYALTYMFGKAALLVNSIDLFKPLIARLFGAKVGKGVAMAGHINEPALVSIGDYSILGHYSVITPHAITSGRIILAKIKIGKEVTIGVNVTIMPGVEIGDRALVMPNSFVPMDTKIKESELWGGEPARKIKDLAQADVRG